MDYITWQQFREGIKTLIESRDPSGEGTDVSRQAVEEVGNELGVQAGEANREFFALRGNVWDLRTGAISASLIDSDEDPEDPDRNWLAINDVYLLR